MNRRHRPALVGAVALLALLPAFRSAGEEPEASPAMAALQARVRDLEAQLAEHTRQLEALTARLTALQPSVPFPPLTAATTASVVPSPAEAPQEEPQADPTNAGYLLPSRSWAGGEPNYGGTGIGLEIHGFADLEYVDAQRDGARAGVSTFDNNHANVFFDPKFGARLRGHVEFEFEHAGDGVEVDQAYIRWGLARGLAIQAGRFYTPFGIERFVWYSPTNVLISRPEPLRQIVPNNFYAQGLMVQGTLAREKKLQFTYEAAVSDGLGDRALVDRRGSRQTGDNNSSRAISGRGGLVIFPWAELGASYHAQRYSTRSDLGLRFVGVDLAARWRGLEFRGEQVAARVERQTEAGIARPDLRQSGWYGQLSYTFEWDRSFLRALSIVVRRDEVDLDETVKGGDDQRYWSWGANANLYEHFRAKLEYRKASEDGPEKKDDTFLSQLVFDF